LDKTKNLYIIAGVSFAVLTVVLCLLFWPFISSLRDPVYREQFSVWIESLGFKGILILFGIQVLQIVVAVIPGEPVELLAGAAYGPLGGLLICLAGCAIASTVIFLMVRKFGQGLVTRFFKKVDLEKFKFLQNRQKTAAVVFVLFLIPSTPKDMLTYIVPLSGFPLSRFILISAFARIPSILSSTMIGDSAANGNWPRFLALFGITALIGFFGIFFTEKIVNFFRNRA
jgi:uncharacterized membrane protein YdjX (TVP38/TMEM64 family)